ncbi:DUF3775 domain-containing protein [Qingshengfaniella alkalisoli]|uniref:DUF3775 domain-containing protein n=1 Tax=Qingshengfaniella alkalisoli TaxID=2599296 RepID=A0A5B8ITD7_9RHOB|nr:DUF3775 domain-containing protein [Qingshengfaniella alkalisoli]QDY68201.1 DUF3775 domain-containing protein [Qingshengfaniella alkalisoli]
MEPEIHADTVAQVILLAREMRDPGTSNKTIVAALKDFIAGLTEDEKLDLVAIMWIGRESFSADEYEEAVDTARQEMIQPTEEYLAKTPLLSDFLENGLDAMGISVAAVENGLY